MCVQLDQLHITTNYQVMQAARLFPNQSSRTERLSTQLEAEYLQCSGIALGFISVSRRPERTSRKYESHGSLIYHSSPQGNGRETRFQSMFKLVHLTFPHGELVNPCCDPSLLNHLCLSFFPVMRRGKPSAFLSASQCDPWKYFVDHQLVFTINLCGKSVDVLTT